MSKKICIKYMIIGLIIMYSNNLFSQDLYLNNINLNNSTCGYFSPNNIYFATNGPNGAANNNLQVGSNGDYLFIAQNKIVLKDNFHISALNQTSNKKGTFTVANQSLNAAILEPINITNVKMFEKVEIGVSLPELDDLINTYINDQTGLFKPETQSYATAINNGSIINPYDPSNICVQAVFFKPSSPNKDGIIKNGFYYQDMRNETIAGVRDWRENSTDYHWRVRFSPDEIGAWAGYISVWINGQLLPKNFFFNFNVVDSDNPGNVQVNPINQRYLKFSKSGEQYFPVGMNYAWTEHRWIGANCVSCDSYNCSNIHDQRIFPNSSDELNTFINTITSNSNNEAITTRFIMAPWGHQIEYEKLGNYSTRNAEMWELDNYIKSVESAGMYVILSMLINDLEYKAPQGNDVKYSDRWDWNPYNNNGTHNSYSNWAFKGIEGVTTPKDFFIKEAARKWFKNKLQYIEARWGYSTSISMWDLVTEIAINDFNNGSPELVDQSNIEKWLAEMTSFLKDTIHSNKLLTATYKGDGTAIAAIYNLWNDPNIDVISVHSYGSSEQISRGEYVEASMILNNTNFNTKPYYLNENDDFLCGRAINCDDRLRHNLTWSTSFIGTCGSGLTWSARRFNLPEVSYGGINDYSGEFEKNYQGISKFMSNVDVINNTFSYHTGFSTNKKFENFYMKKFTTNSLIAGWVHNRSYNQFNFPDNCYYTPTPTWWYKYPDTDINDIMFDDPQRYAADWSNYFWRDQYYEGNWWYLNAPQLSPSDSRYIKTGTNAQGESIYESRDSYFSNQDNYINAFQSNAFTYFGIDNNDVNNAISFHVSPGTLYDVKWYWTWGENKGEIYTTNQYYSNAMGTLIVIPPKTGIVNGTKYPGDWAYIIEPASLTKSVNNIGIGVENYNPEELAGISVFPNPAKDKVFVKIGVESSESIIIEIYNTVGALMLKKEIENNKLNEIDVSHLKNGMYSYILKSSDAKITTGKLVINGN
jgi:hypothetical protein